MISLAANQDLSPFERVLYPILVYAVSWVFVIVGVYLAGPEIIAKIKDIYTFNTHSHSYTTSCAKRG